MGRGRISYYPYPRIPIDIPIRTLRGTNTQNSTWGIIHRDHLSSASTGIDTIPTIITKDHLVLKNKENSPPCKLRKSICGQPIYQNFPQPSLVYLKQQNNLGKWSLKARSLTQTSNCMRVSTHLNNHNHILWESSQSRNNKLSYRRDISPSTC